MSLANVGEVMRDLSRDLEPVAQGEEVVIASAGNPVAKLVRGQALAAPWLPGYWKGKVRIAADLDQLPPEIAAALWRGSTESCRIGINVTNPKWRLEDVEA